MPVCASINILRVSKLDEERKKKIDELDCSAQKPNPKRADEPPLDLDHNHILDGEHDYTHEAGDGAFDDTSVISALTCDLDHGKRFTPQGNKARSSSEKKNAQLIVNGLLHVPALSCSGISEVVDGYSERSSMDLSDSSISMTVSVKPGSWKLIKDLDCTNELGMYSSAILSDDVSNSKPTPVSMRSSLIVSVHKKSISNPLDACMLGFVVITMKSILESPQISENIYIVEKPFSSESFSVHPNHKDEVKVKVSGTLCVQVSVMNDPT